MILLLIFVLIALAGGGVLVCNNFPTKIYNVSIIIILHNTVYEPPCDVSLSQMQAQFVTT